MTTRLDQFAALEAAVTAAPWTANEAGYLANYERDAYIAHGQDGAGAIARSEDGFFIAAARNLAPAFIRLARAAQTLVARLDAVHAHPAYQSVWMNDYAHGGRYDGPTYNLEVDDVRAALAPLLAEAPDA